MNRYCKYIPRSYVCNGKFYTEMHTSKGWILMESDFGSWNMGTRVISITDKARECLLKSLEYLKELIK